jgi:hypothetical protein
MNLFGNGWFAGRCYTKNEPKIEKGPRFKAKHFARKVTRVEVF